MTYTWESATVGDASPIDTIEITAEQIAEYCRAARYENLVYTNQPAARETGLPGIVAPPAMILTCAPVRLKELAAVKGCLLPSQLALNPVSIAMRFQGTLIIPGDIMSFQTRLTHKREADGNRYLTFTVTARKADGELAAEYDAEYRWE